MELANFEQSNKVYNKPDGEKSIIAASVFEGKNSDGKDVVITCWKLTKEELEEIKKTGRVWCTHLGNFLQPHILSGKSPFDA